MTVPTLEEALTPTAVIFFILVILPIVLIITYETIRLEKLKKK